MEDDDEYYGFSEIEKHMVQQLKEKFERIAIWIKDQNQLETWLILFWIGWQWRLPLKEHSLSIMVECSVEYLHCDNVHGMRYSADVRSFCCSKHKRHTMNIIMSSVSAENMVKNSGSKWEASKLNFAINGVKTSIYRIRTCIKASLDIIDKCALYASHWSYDDVVDLGHQEKYMHIMLTTSCIQDSPNSGVQHGMTSEKYRVQLSRYPLSEESEGTFWQSHSWYWATSSIPREYRCNGTWRRKRNSLGSNTSLYESVLVPHSSLKCNSKFPVGMSKFPVQTRNFQLDKVEISSWNVEISSWNVEISSLKKSKFPVWRSRNFQFKLWLMNQYAGTTI